jgi:hypothetical protein
MSVDFNEKHSKGWSHQKNKVVKAGGEVLFKTDRDINIQDEIDIALVVCAPTLLKAARALWEYHNTKERMDLWPAFNEAEKALLRYDGLIADIEHDHKVKA